MQIEVTSDVFRLAQVFTISRGSRTEAKVLTVRITDGGVTGVGECVPYARYGETLESVTAQIAGLSGVLTREGLYDLLPAGAARNAVDCALWDLEAKRSGTPVWQLAGLAPLKPEMTAYTLSLDMPENMRAQAAKNAFRPLLKIKLGTPDDMPRLEAVRAGAPDSTIIVDANEGWSAAVYADLAPHLVRLGVALVEQPLPAGEDDALIGMTRPVIPTLTGLLTFLSPVASNTDHSQPSVHCSDSPAMSTALNKQYSVPLTSFLTVTVLAVVA